MIPIEPETLPTAKELRSTVAGLSAQVSEYARRGDNHGCNTALSQLQAAKVELAQAERRELAEAATASRLKSNRARAGMDGDGGLKASGYSSPGELIADRLRRGPVQVGLERALRDAGITPPAA